MNRWSRTGAGSVSIWDVCGSRYRHSPCYRGGGISTPSSMLGVMDTRLIAVGVFAADLAISPMHNDLDLVATSHRSSALDRRLLRSMRGLDIAGLLNLPASGVWLP